MASWGYRVYTFKMLAGTETLAQEIPQHRERFLEVLELVGKETRVGKPHRASLDVDADMAALVESGPLAKYETTQPTLTVRNSTYAPDLGVIHARVALGEHGLHDYAVNPEDGADRIAVSDRSAETPRRLDIFFATSQFEGIMVAEVVGMKDPVSLLRAWINKESSEHRKAILRKIDETNDLLDKDGNKISKTAARRLVPKSIRLRAERIADPILLQRILDDIKSMDTEFTQLDESNRETNKRLIFKVTEKSAQKNIIDRLISGGAGNTTSIIKQTLEDLEIDQVGLEAANIDVNTVKARIHSSEGNTTLTPGKLSELFNYRFKNSGRPSNAPYYSTVLNKIRQLTIPAGIALAIPADTEMIDWIDSKESAWNPQLIEVSG